MEIQSYLKLEIFHNSGNLFGQSPKTCARAFIYPASSPSIGQVHSNQLDIPVFTFRISNGLSVITKCREHAENHASWRASVDQWSIACILISKLSLDLVYNRTKGCIKFIRFWYSWIFSCVLKNSNVRKKYSINSLFKIRIFIISSKNIILQDLLGFSNTTQPGPLILAYFFASKIVPCATYTNYKDSNA
ncbi:hypothetical protein RCL_jg9388.t1 [Rhizophagus clarus]|uniref:Uncharacterized protein n=1 Tax=Rhizophagus clarus TaxID=94130 RepID=A0A8H3R1E7_9GLOM|nr:hypothetical protein RCL_jg9388.t1 [Rhizophagus clarus]